MYVAPVLEKYGTLRDLTEGKGGTDHTINAKRYPLMNDLATVFGPGGNFGCNYHAQPWSHAGCLAVSA
jgi:hypothetical protein